ncbi:MAG: hypothetical protein Kow00120_18730 [Anaerolineae bacterium]
MRALDLRVRYFQDSTPDDVPCREENFIRREFVMRLPVDQTAFVLVDMWSVHHIDSWIERVEEVTARALLPALDAARAVGLSIIHAPSPLIAPQYPEHMKRHAPPPPPELEDDWPPPAFRARQGAYHAYRGPREQPPGVWPRWDRVAPQLRMSPAVEVRDDDCVIATGQQMHEFLKARGMLHLIYVGYATNWCILSRDYGVRAMQARGYNPILLRDATMGVEFPDTLANCFATEMAIREVEQVHGFSASNADFFTACDAASGK